MAGHEILELVIKQMGERLRRSWMAVWMTAQSQAVRRPLRRGAERIAHKEGAAVGIAQDCLFVWRKAWNANGATTARAIRPLRISP